MAVSHYLISGLRVASDFPLCGVVAASVFDSEADVYIRRGAVPRSLPNPDLTRPNWMMAEQDFLLHIPTVARLRVMKGREIVVDSERDASDSAPFVLGTAFGTLLHQRGAMVLHASAVSHKGRALALCGPSGAGKSSLAAALCQGGSALICDDVAAIHFDADGVPQVLPDSRQHRLWDDMIEHLDLAGSRGEAVRDTMEKYHVSPTSEPVAMPLSTIVSVREAAFANMAPTLEPLELADAAALLRTDIYRNALARKMGRDAALFGQAARLLGQVRMLRLTRPRESGRMLEAVELLHEHLAQTP